MTLKTVLCLVKERGPVNPKITGLLIKINRMFGITWEMESQLTETWTEPISTLYGRFEDKYNFEMFEHIKLNPKQFRKIAEENEICIPYVKEARRSGYLPTFLMIYENSEPLIFYPQMRNSDEVTIEEFLESLVQRNPKSIASKINSKVLREKFFGKSF